MQEAAQEGPALRSENSNAHNSINSQEHFVHFFQKNTHATRRNRRNNLLINGMGTPMHVGLSRDI